MNILEYIKSSGYAAEEDAQGEPWYSEMYHGLHNNVSKHSEGSELATISVFFAFFQIWWTLALVTTLTAALYGLHFWRKFSIIKSKCGADTFSLFAVISAYYDKDYKDGRNEPPFSL